MNNSLVYCDHVANIQTHERTADRSAIKVHVVPVLDSSYPSDTQSFCLLSDAPHTLLNRNQVLYWALVMDSALFLGSHTVWNQPSLSVRSYV